MQTEKNPAQVCLSWKPERGRFVHKIYIFISFKQSSLLANRFSKDYIMQI